MPPRVYLFHGEDEFTIAQEIQKLEEKLGDPVTASLNTTRLDGRTLSFNELENVVQSMPFLAPRRLVVVVHPLAKMENNQALQEKFLALLDQLPESTGLVLVEYRSLEREKYKPRWLLEWVKNSGESAFMRLFPYPNMPKWIQEQARREGGEFTFQAASALAGLVTNDTRLASQEIVKLLAYAAYRRPVEVEDVDLLVAATGQASIFEFVDALGMQDAYRAMKILHRLLEDEDAQYIFSMIVRQFRLLLQAREMLDNGKTLGEVTKTLKLHEFVGKKVIGQAQRFSMDILEAIYRRLLEMDESIKTGLVEPDLALEAFVAGFVPQSVKPSIN